MTSVMIAAMSSWLSASGPVMTRSVSGGLLVGQGADGDGRDVLGVDEADPAAFGGGPDGAVVANAAGVGVRAGEVLHEPRGPQYRPLFEQIGQGLVHRSHRRAARGDGRGAQQHRAVHAGGAGLMEERQHDRRGVGVAQGWYEVDAVDAVEGGGVGGGVVPVEADRSGAGYRAGQTAGGFDAVAGGRQLRGDAAAGGAGGADDQSGAGGGHRRLPGEVGTGFEDGEGVPVVAVGRDVPVSNGHDRDVGHVEGGAGLHQAADAAHLDHDGLRIGGLVDPQGGEVVQVDVVGVVAHVGGDGLLALQAPGPALGGEGGRSITPSSAHRPTQPAMSLSSSSRRLWR
ncbi:hypothetical protein SAFG77S_04624 [Streptomyces afghaniensis]